MPGGKSEPSPYFTPALKMLLEERDTVFRMYQNRLVNGDNEFEFRIPRVVARQRPNISMTVYDGDGFLTSQAQTMLTVGGYLTSEVLVDLHIKVISDQPDQDNGKAFDLEVVNINGLVLGQHQAVRVGKWERVTVSVPVGWVKFGRFDEAYDGYPAEPFVGINKVLIRTYARDLTGDKAIKGGLTLNPQGLIAFDAIAPVIFIHGAGDTGGEWLKPSTIHRSDVGWDYDNILDFFGPDHTPVVPFFNGISLGVGGGGSIASNAKQLTNDLPWVLSGFGAKRCHLVAHSKGGLDSRGFLGTPWYKKQFEDGRSLKAKVLSLYTFSTPHRGSVQANIAFEMPMRKARDTDTYGANELASSFAKQYNFWMRLGVNYIGPARNTAKNLTTGFMADFNAQNALDVPQNQFGLKFYNLAADADIIEVDKIITNLEAAGEPMWNYDAHPEYKNAAPGTDEEQLNAKNDLADLAYQVILQTPGWKTDANTTQRLGETEDERKNDLRVPIYSGLYYNDFAHMIQPVGKQNHMTVRDRQGLDKAVTKMKTDYPLDAVDRMKGLGAQ
jgi:pimeloyl-ACP methyl ester carboxylesterase